MAKAGWKSVIVTQAIAATVFVGVPILLTLMAPYTDLTLRRTGPAASVTITRYVLIFIPWQVRTIDGVAALRAEVKNEKYHADTAENRRKGTAGATEVATAQLVIEGGGQRTIVMADPDLAVETEAGFARYLASADAEEETWHLRESFWLSTLMGGIATFFAGFYVFGCVVASVKWLLARGRANG